MSSINTRIMLYKGIVALIIIIFGLLMLIGYAFMPISVNGTLMPISIFYYLIVLACLLAYGRYFRWCIKHSH